MDLPEAEDWTFSDWIKAQTTLQVAGGKGDPIDTPLENIPDFFRWNSLAIVAEVIEATDEVKWKPWASGEVFVNRERVIGELVDAMHFIGNELRAVGATGPEVTAAYRAKAQKNLDRWQAGYTGLDKCSVCRRDAGEIGTCQVEDCPYISGSSQIGCWFDDCTESGTIMADATEDSRMGPLKVRVRVCPRHEKELRENLPR